MILPILPRSSKLTLSIYNTSDLWNYYLGKYFFYPCKPLGSSFSNFTIKPTRR